MRLLSSEAKGWKSRVVSEAEQVLVKESAEAAHRPMRYKKPWTSAFKPVGNKQKHNSGICMSPAALEYSSLPKVCNEVNWNTSSYMLPMRDACSRRHTPSEGHKTWNNELLASLISVRLKSDSYRTSPQPSPIVASTCSTTHWCMGTIGPFAQVPPTTQASVELPRLQHFWYASATRRLA